MTTTASEHKRAREVFLEARELPEEQRAAFLQRACGDDADLRANVESLLTHDSGDDADLDIQSRIGTRIGRYHIRSVIGSGGMGTVYQAVQESPHRVVALKLMRTGIATRSAQRRFEYEAQTLGRLRHPGIAQIFEAGVHEEGRAPLPYFAMEYVPGAKTILEFAAAKQLSLRERVELFAKVCDAVHHGHQKAIIHRDLKPDNILVDSAGSIKVIDFGVARSTDSDLAVTTLQTNIGQLVGTVQYMSPEQCAADPNDIDTRSDVYSLGVVLYQLLCDQAPYDVSGTNLPSASRMVCEAPVPRPRDVQRTVRGNLERVVLQALERDRDKRYQSASELADDLRHWMRGEPVSAQGAGLTDIMRRIIVKHPIWVTASICISMFAVAAGLLFATWLSLHLLDKRPHNVISDADNVTTAIVTWTGRPLHTFHTDTEYPPAVKIPISEDKWLAAIGFGWQAPAYAGHFVVFDPHNIETPLWMSERYYPEFEGPHESLRQARAEYGPNAIPFVADIFPEHPGVELVMSYTLKEMSATSIRIHDPLTGEVLYETWHDGTAAANHWFSEPGLLIVCGHSNRLLGEDVNCGAGTLVNPRNTAYPTVVFAIRPQLGMREKHWIGSPDSNSPCKAVWYKAWGPCEMMYDLEKMQFGEGASGVDPQTHFQISFMHTGANSQASVTIDQTGRIVGRSFGSSAADGDARYYDSIELMEAKGYDPNVRDRMYWSSE